MFHVLPRKNNVSSFPVSIMYTFLLVLLNSSILYKLYTIIQMKFAIIFLLFCIFIFCYICSPVNVAYLTWLKPVCSLFQEISLLVHNVLISKGNQLAGSQCPPSVYQHNLAGCIMVGRVGYMGALWSNRIGWGLKCDITLSKFLCSTIHFLSLLCTLNQRGYHPALLIDFLLPFNCHWLNKLKNYHPLCSSQYVSLRCSL